MDYTIESGSNLLSFLKTSHESHYSNLKFRFSCWSKNRLFIWQNCAAIFATCASSSAKSEGPAVEFLFAAVMKWNSWTDMGGSQQGIKRALERDIAHNSSAINVAIQGAFHQDDQLLKSRANSWWNLRYASTLLLTGARIPFFRFVRFRLSLSRKHGPWYWNTGEFSSLSLVFVEDQSRFK